MSLQQDQAAINDGINGWNQKNMADLKGRLNALNVQHAKRSPNKISLQRALKSSLKKRSGLVNRISYQMPRSAIFLHKGVGKGRPASNPKGAKEWFNPVVDKNLNTLADIVADGAGNMIINNINIK